MLPPLPPGMPLMYWFSRRMTLWGSISFNLAVFINIIIAFFYPYVEATSMGECPGTCCSWGWKGKGSSHAGKLALPSSLGSFRLLKPQVLSAGSRIESGFQFPALPPLPSQGNLSSPGLHFPCVCSVGRIHSCGQAKPPSPTAVLSPRIKDVREKPPEPAQIFAEQHHRL